MDRANNRIGIRIGAVARTPEEVVLRARRELERAIPWSGSGHDSTAIWLPSREWRTLGRDAEEGEAQSTWPRVEWRPIEDAEHLSVTTPDATHSPRSGTAARARRAALAPRLSGRICGPVTRCAPLSAPARGNLRRVEPPSRGG